MKRKLLFIVPIIIVLALLASCSMPTAPDPDNPDLADESSAANQASASGTKLTVFTDDGSSAKNLTLLDSYDCSVGNTGLTATFARYTKASQNADGSFGDGEWVLLGTIDGGTTELFRRQYLKKGSVDYNIFTAGDGTFHVIITACQESGIEITDCVFDLSTRAFYQRSALNYSGGTLNT